MITKEQLWYLYTIYPKAITQDEAMKDYHHCVPYGSEEDDYWYLVAKIINKLNNENFLNP